MELSEILGIAVKGGASDLHLKAGLPPMFRVHGSLVPLNNSERVRPEDIRRMLAGIMTDLQKERLLADNELDMSYGVPRVGRFRVNVFQQRGSIGAVFRVIPPKVQDIDELGLPPILKTIALEQRGLILVTGTTGSGKSTTLAAMLDYINSNRASHILTIEDPIEFLIRDKRSIVNQREVGVDTNAFSIALRSALRQDPDVILVGEMRDLETIEIALTAAETGHLVMSTVHTLDATETISRILSVFPPHQQRGLRLQLASVLRAIISQRLVPRADGTGRAAALEILRSTSHVRDLIEDPERTRELPDAIAKGTTTYGTQTFDQALMGLLSNGTISYEEALRQANNPDDLALRVAGIQGTSDSRWDVFESTEPAPQAGHAAPNVSPAPAQPVSPAPKTTVLPVDDDFQIEPF